MLSTSKSVLGFVLGVVAAGAMALAGCSKSADQASRDLRQKVDVAQRLANNALGIAGEPAVLSADGRAVRAADDPNSLQILPACAVLPEALVKLNEAQQQIKSALSEYPDASPADRALATATLGKVQAMAGYVYAAGVASDLSPVWDNLRKASDLVADLGAKAELAAYYGSFMNTTDAEAKKLQATSQDELQKESAQLKTLEAEVKTQVDILKDLGPKQEQLLKEASSLRVQSKGATGKVALDQAEQAMDKQAQANTIASQIAEAEVVRDAKDAQRKVVAGEVELAKALEAVGKEGVGSAETRAAEFKAKREAMEASVAENVRKLEVLAGEINTALVKAAADEKPASEAYEAAAQGLEKSYTGLDQADQAEFAAQRALTAMAQAKLLEIRVAAVTAAASLGEQVKALWPKLQRPNEMPAAFAALTAPGADPAKMKEDQAKLYQVAIENFRKAMPKVRAELRWAYQGEVGAAYLGLYHVTQSRDSLTEAQKVLAEAVQNKEFSPYLTQVVELQKQVDKLLKTNEQ